MPVRYKKKARVGRRKTRRFKSNKSGVVTTRAYTNRVRPNFGMPNIKYCKFVYGDEFSISNSSSNFNVYEFNMNSLHDPDFSGGGHQPRQWDQLKVFYRGYIVYGLSAVIEAYTTDTSSSGEGFCVGFTTRSNDSAIPGSYNDILERTNQRVKCRSISQPNPTTKIHTGYLRCHAVQGVTRNMWNHEDQYQAGVGASPPIMPKLTVFAYSRDGTALGATKFTIRITYYAKMFDVVQNNQS